jgi:hypothetical protein
MCIDLNWPAGILGEENFPWIVLRRREQNDSLASLGQAEAPCINDAICPHEVKFF